MVVINRGIRGMGSSPSAGMAVVSVLTMAGGILLLAGLWTPVSGSMTAALGLWSAISQAGDLEGGILLASIGAGLTLLGPGAWSADARLFGWKRIDVYGPKK